MRTRIFKTAALFVIAAIALGFSACGDDSFVEKKRPVMKLIDLKVQPVSFESGMPVDKPDVVQLTVESIPEPVIEKDWNDNFYNLSEADSEELWFLIEEDVQVARVIASVTPGCRVQWGIGNSGTRPAYFTNLGAPLSISDNDFIYIRVSAAAHGEEYANYYRVHARMASPVTLISVITVSGRETKVGFDEGRETWEELRAAGVKELPVSVAVKEAVGAEIITTKMNDSSTVKYAVVKGAYNSLDFASLDFANADDKTIMVYDPEDDIDKPVPGAVITLADQDLLVAEVTAHNQHDKNYYKFRVSVGRIANISSLAFDASEVLTVGIPNPTWASVLPGSFGTAGQPETGFSIKIELEDEDASYEIGKINGGAPVPSLGKPDKIHFDNKQELVIKVESATKVSGTPAVTMYYKVRVDLLAAIITEQPQSAVYTVLEFNYPRTEVTIDIDGTETTYQRVLIDADGTRTLDREPVPLEAKLDREVPGASYQWYTANSWYGGYGFDRYGRIVGDPGKLVDGFHPNTDRGGLDEKNNVSFHNGGNMWTRLPIGYPLDMPRLDYDFENRANYGRVSGFLPYPAIKIEGATSSTYTPKIDASKRPFISGYSNQTSYYWVVITDNEGREVMSERATIVAEWGEVWEKGVPTGIKVTKKHHIMDLNKDLGLPKKNLVPFTYKREHYIIPLKFPGGFNIADYSVATCQAVFYLRDGRTWIQNWTQGDVYFNVGTDRVVGYYNLTNNNATLGLSGDSRDPQGASIWSTPTHIVIAPSGEKPPNDLPPFLGDGITPMNIDDAQGWFTAYIEIVELRFEGPARRR